MVLGQWLRFGGGRVVPRAARLLVLFLFLAALGRNLRIDGLRGSWSIVVFFGSFVGMVLFVGQRGSWVAGRSFLVVSLSVLPSFLLVLAVLVVELLMVCALAWG